MTEATEKVEQLTTQVNELTAALHDVVRVILEEQFVAYAVTGETKLAEMMEDEPEFVLEEQFLIPQSAQKHIDATPQGIIKMVDQEQLEEISQTELEIGFRREKLVEARAAGFRPRAK